MYFFCLFFFFNDTATTEIYTLLYTLSLHDALPICTISWLAPNWKRCCASISYRSEEHTSELQSHSNISYAVFCLKKKKKPKQKTINKIKKKIYLKKKPKKIK